MPSLVDNNDPRSLASEMRRRRLRWLVEFMKDLPEPIRILDVGGTAIFWRNNRDLLIRKHHITVLNLTASDSNSSEIAFVAGDARAMPQFGEGEFDLCFSNSVIEHVGAWDDQQAMAREVQRVAKHYFVQTPSRWFPIEPHFLVPGWQFLPTGLRAFLLTKFKIGWMDRQPTYEAARAEVEQIRLLTGREMHKLFPGATIQREKFCGLTKSFVALGSSE
jgi:hypothetical protein